VSSFKYVRGSYARDARLKTQAARGNAPWLPKNFSDMVFEVLVPHSRAPGTRPPAEFPLSLGHYQPQVEPLGAFCAANASVGKIVAVASTPDILVNLDVLVRRVNQQLQAASRPPIPRPVNVTSANRMPYRCPWQCFYLHCSECFGGVRTAYAADTHALRRIYSVPASAADLWPPATTHAEQLALCAPCTHEY
jgi:hypothetical protein